MSRDLALAERVAVAEQSCVLAAFESAVQGMAIIDEHGRVVAANRRITAMARENNGTLLPGGEFARVFDLPFEIIAEGGERQLGDSWFQISRSDTGDGAYLLVFNDITALKEREQQHRDAKSQAEAASLSKSRFLANVSHELRTPLNAIIGFSEIIAGEILGPGVNRKYREYAANIVESARHLLDIINSVLDLAKNDAGKLRVAEESVEINDIVEGCLRLVQDQCERAQLTLEVKPSPEPVRVNADSTKLRQVFLNLLSNAIKFTEPDGAISVAVEPLDPERVTVVIGDTGIGMAPDEIPIALAPFEQVDNKLARRYQGTGLGLPLAKALIELQGGSLAIASEPGKGTRVRVSLRRHEPVIADELTDGSVFRG
jgi:signal transduction histidine kinase